MDPEAPDFDQLIEIGSLRVIFIVHCNILPYLSIFICAAVN